MYYFDRLLADFHPYFEPLKETVRKLWATFNMDQSMKPGYIPPTYDEFLDVLKAGRDALPLVDDPPPENGIVAQPANNDQPAEPASNVLHRSRRYKRSRTEEDEVQDVHATRSGSHDDAGLRDRFTTSERNKRSRLSQSTSTRVLRSDSKKAQARE
ncbi:hypothetical protein PUNSTDRAFT_133663 [Punctularia strigosozonata HHB-11173 SS5]|uniref:uncharacterized protein n=1 Tax=Punctularia strigosozonata (strain HHB-11173) TaxID=741275 RepID=UPI00044185D2|nr:uncharacterized protein PUNSTDRAFT_133663 [Punctularia strigosozonata HHB-11173 SS5]EIN09891.1 hypothetical protein PUNSTDRAFT_133663 [Punctularia strigosozonata HHB-11173 SS5]